jgi:hypothetical protein
MALFNYKANYRRTNDVPGVSNLLVDFEYDDAFEVRQRALLVFPPEVDHITVGGTASTNPVVIRGTISHFDSRGTYAYVYASTGTPYKCLFSKDEKLKPFQSVLVAEHLSHTDKQLNKFDWLVTAREAEFGLNSIRIIGKDCNGVEVNYINIDPYIGTIKYNGMNLP